MKKEKKNKENNIGKKEIIEMRNNRIYGRTIQTSIGIEKGFCARSIPIPFSILHY